MTIVSEGVYSTGVNVEVFPDEFMPILKVLNCAIAMPEKFALTDSELGKIRGFQGDFADVAFEYGT